MEALLIEIRDLQTQKGAGQFIEDFVIQNLPEEYTKVLLCKLMALDKEQLCKIAMKCLTKELRPMFGLALFKMHKESIAHMLLFADHLCEDGNVLDKHISLSEGDFRDIFNRYLLELSMEELYQVRYNFEDYLTKEINYYSDE